MTIANTGLQAADLRNKYNKENIAQQFGHFLAQNQFGQQRRQSDFGFNQKFPQFTGQWAGRLGRAGNIRSGLFGEQMNQMNQQHLDQQGQINFNQAQMEAQYVQQQAERRAALERALAALAGNQ